MRVELHRGLRLHRRGFGVTQRPRDSLRVVSKFLRSAHEPLNLVSLLVLPIHDNPSTAGPTASVLDGNADLIVVRR